MVSAVSRLRRILLLEREQGCADRIVIGGLARFLGYLEQELHESANAESAELRQALRTLAPYGHMSPPERCAAIDIALQTLAGSAGAEVGPQAAVSPPTGPASPPQPPSPASGPDVPLPRGTPAGRMAEYATPAPRALQRASTARTASEAGSAVRLSAPVTAIKGISTVLQGHLERLAIYTVRDLLYHLPRRYDDYSQLKTIDRLCLGEEVTIVGTVRDVRTQRKGSNLAIVRATISDRTGAIEASWFGSPFLAQSLRRGTEIVLSGRVEQYLGRLVFRSPEWEPLQRELLHTARVVPVYPLTRGIGSRRMRSLVRGALGSGLPSVQDPLPKEMAESAGLMDLATALSQIHFPDDLTALARARERLCFDEFLMLQLGVLRRRTEWQSQQGTPLPAPSDLLERFSASLPFALTNAQERAIATILSNMAEQVPMRRLLQGDVGSGKTVVAVAAMLATVNSGHQAAVLVPTSILAEQHYQTISALLSPLGIRCSLLVGSLTATAKQRVRDEAARGEIQVLVGTHALIQESVRLPHLAFLVVDEQHRFGVLQRSALVERGSRPPHLLAMSATPIPRSLAMTLYGDLDISVLDTLPPGRQPVITAIREHTDRERIYRFIESQVREGHQVFVVCPTIDEGETNGAKGVLAEQRRLQESVFPQLRVGLLHGRMAADEKDRVMAAYKAREIDILVATSVIEVGIDMPNATVMLVEGADRFGLAQLHQLRGRIGRGEYRSYCILVSDDPSQAAMDRLRAMEETSDGFALAEQDLLLRGPGDFFGVRQHGLPSLRVAGLGDTRILDLAREQALYLFHEDPDLTRPEHRLLAAAVDGFWAEAPAPTN